MDLDPLAPAAIAYTSGTTGVPKGAVHSQHSLVLPPEVVVHGDGGRPFVQGCLLPLTIINMQVLATVQTLLGGGSLIVMDRIDVEGVVEWIHAEGIERVYATPRSSTTCSPAPTSTGTIWRRSCTSSSAAARRPPASRSGSSSGSASPSRTPTA